MDESVGNETVDTGTGTDEVTTSDEGSQTEPPVIRADSNFHDISLDVKKSGQTINEPIVIRTDDTDDVIRVHLKKDGQPYTGIKSATFYGTKQDLTIIANDPATVEDDVLLYSVPKGLANVGGKIKDAYFMIDGKITTENFVITVFKTVDFKGESKDYIPGLNVLIDKWNATSKEWIKKMDGLGKEVDGIDTNKILKDKIDKATDDAKTDYMADFNKSVDKLNDVIADLTTKENTAVDKGKELDKAIDNVNSKINDVNNWLTTVQEEIKSANAEFIKGQQDSVEVDITALKKTISDTQELADKLSSQVDAIKNSVDSINIPQINADTKTALENSKEAKDIAGGLSGKIGDVPEGSNVMAELAKAGKIDSATVNGKSVPISDKTLQITVPDPDLSSYATNKSVDSKLEPYAKTADIPKNYLKQWQGTADDYTAIESKDNSTEYSVLNDDGSIKNIYVGSKELYREKIAPGTLLAEGTETWNSTGKGWSSLIHPENPVEYQTSMITIGNTVEKEIANKGYVNSVPLDPHSLENGIILTVESRQVPGESTYYGEYSFTFEYAFGGFNSNDDSTKLIFSISKEELISFVQEKLKSDNSSLYIKTGPIQRLMVQEDGRKYTSSYVPGMEYKTIAPCTLDGIINDDKLIENISIKVDLPSYKFGDGKTTVETPTSLYIVNVKAY